MLGIGAHPTAGFNLGAATSRYALVSAGFSYIPLARHVLGPPLATTGVTGSHLYDVDAGGRFRIPVSEWYLTAKWGFEPEVRVYLGRHKFARASLGVFYQFP